LIHRLQRAADEPAIWVLLPQAIGDSSAAIAEDFHMATIATALVIFGLIMIGLAIFNPTNAGAGRRVAGASVGIAGLLLGLLLGASRDHDDWRDRS
jgi:hypothetical protein